jgi:hypothetical protein
MSGGAGLFSGECADCAMEVEASVDELGVPTYETYPRHGPTIDIPPNDYGFDSESDSG